MGVFLTVVTLLLPVAVFGQVNLPQNGTWSGGTVKGSQTVSLNGNVRITGTIVIPNNASLTVTNSTYGEVNISRSDDIVMLRVEDGGTLKITGQEGKEIVVDGGADMTWNSDVFNAQKEKEWENYYNHAYKYVPLTGKHAHLSSMIETNGNLNLEHVKIQNLNAGDNAGFAIYVAAAVNKVYGKTNLTNCTITKCRSDRGAAIFVGGQNGNTSNTNESCAVSLENVTITQCMVNPLRYDNTGGTEEAWGGVIRFSGKSVGNLNMTNCIMKENYSTGDGSCIWWNAGGNPVSPSKLVLNGCRFENNRSDRDAGAVRLESGFDFVGTKTVFENNSCGRYGGAIQVADYNGGKNNVEVTSYDYNLNDKLEVKGNYAALAGGGIAFYYVANDLDAGFTFNINLNGQKVTENKAGERGGGIIFTDLKDQTVDGYKQYNFHIYLNSGTISNNTAVKAGGGIFAKKMTISTNTSGDKVTINGNKVTAAAGVETGGKGGGGGINLYDGTMTLNTCEITDNTVIGADGKTDLTNGYGGGIILNRCDFTMDGTNNISGNTANVGGGVAVLNETDADRTVQLTSGTITGNAANMCGGGLAIVGNVKVTVDGINITNNKALNGGGIYMRGITTGNTDIAGTGKGATLTYTGGQITGNNANKKEDESVLNNTTANKKTTENISGMGGGICVGANSTLELLIREREKLGIQNNIADNGADDVFCNGTSGTMVVLPNVSQMELENGNRLFWVEDYITNDTDYKQGTYVNSSWNNDNIRFRDALGTNRMDQVFRLSESPNYTFTEKYGESEAIYQKFTDKYICLTLGSVMSYIVLRKTGMEERDNAIFKIYRWAIEDGEDIPTDVETNPDYFYMTIILTDNDKFGDFRRKNIQALYGYYYYIKETPWSWAYTTSASDPNNGVRRIDRNALSEASRTFTFTNTPKPDSPPHAEAVKVNEMPGK